MSVTFRPAVREDVTLMVGIAGGTGSGKSFSGMRLATGLAQGKRFAVIDSENRRALHYSDIFQFDHADLRAPFRPEAYADAIEAADKAGYPVIVIDQFSYEHAGEGGLLDWQEEELTRMAGDDWKKREACKMASWIRPKGSHKHMMQKLLQVRAHLVILLRAEQKIEMVKDDKGKWIIQPKKSPVGAEGWLPIAEKNLPYELTCSFLLTADAPGVPKPIKLQSQHRPMFPLDKEISEESGERLAAWARGGAAPATVAGSQREPPHPLLDGPTISAKEAADLEAYCEENKVAIGGLLKAAKVSSVEFLPSAARAREWVDKAVKAREAYEAVSRG